MPGDAIKRFCDKFNDSDGFDHIMDAPVLVKLRHDVEKFGKNMEDASKELFKKGKKAVSNPHNVTPPTIAETAFIEPKRPTALYNAQKEDAPKLVTQKKSNLFSNLSYGIDDWDLYATAKKNDKKYTVYAGENVGLEYKSGVGTPSEHTIFAGINSMNGKMRIKYSTKTNAYNASATVFKQKDKVGATLSYYDKHNNYNVNLSGDNENISGTVGTNINLSDTYKVKASAYANYSLKKPEDNAIGINLSLRLR